MKDRHTSLCFMLVKILFINVICTVIAHKDGNDLQRCFSGNGLTTVITCPGSGLCPTMPRREIYVSLRNTGVCDRLYEQIRSKHIAVGVIPASSILRKLIEKRTHYRSSQLVCFTHTFANVWAKTFTQQQVTFQNFIDFFSPSPDLVILSRTELADAINIFYVAFIVWRAFSVQTEYRRKYTPRKPAHHIFGCRPRRSAQGLTHFPAPAPVIHHKNLWRT